MTRRSRREIERTLDELEPTSTADYDPPELSPEEKHALGDLLDVDGHPGSGRSDAQARLEAIHGQQTTNDTTDHGS